MTDTSYRPLSRDETNSSASVIICYNFCTLSVTGGLRVAGPAVEEQSIGYKELQCYKHVDSMSKHKTRVNLNYI